MSDPKYNDTKDFIASVILGAVVIGVIIGIIVLMYHGGKLTGYDDGYCAALGATRIEGNRLCNLDGRVVEIP